MCASQFVLPRRPDVWLRVNCVSHNASELHTHPDYYRLHAQILKLPAVGAYCWRSKSAPRPDSTTTQVSRGVCPGNAVTNNNAYLVVVKTVCRPVWLNPQCNRSYTKGNSIWRWAQGTLLDRYRPLWPLISFPDTPKGDATYVTPATEESPTSKYYINLGCVSTD